LPAAAVVLDKGPEPERGAKLAPADRATTRGPELCTLRDITRADFATLCGILGGAPHRQSELLALPSREGGIAFRGGTLLFHLHGAERAVPSRGESVEPPDDHQGPARPAWTRPGAARGSHWQCDRWPPVPADWAAAWASDRRVLLRKGQIFETSFRGVALSAEERELWPVALGWTGLWSRFPE